MTTEDIHDSPNPWVAEHIRRFEQTDGIPRPGMNDLLLITRGRRSGKLRRTPLVYVQDDNRYLVAASNRGADRHPAWYLNLVADPDVTVQVGSRVFPARARTANSGERPRLWQLMIAEMCSYRDYQAATVREIPVVVLEPPTCSRGLSERRQRDAAGSRAGRAGHGRRPGASTVGQVDDGSDLIRPISRWISVSEATSPTVQTGTAG